MRRLSWDMHKHLSPAVIGEVLSRHEMLDEAPTQVSHPALAWSPLLTGRDMLLSPGAGLTTWC